MSKKMFKFQDNKFYRANRAAKKFWRGDEDEDKRASEGK